MPKLDCTKRAAKINLLDKSSRTKWEFADAVDCDSTLNVDGIATLAGGATLTGTVTLPVTVNRLVTTTIADPGNTTKVIPVTSSGYVELVTGGAETRTLAVPTFAGQMLMLTMKTDGGDCVVTVADPHIDGTNNTITFNDAGDTVLLIAGTSGSGNVWRLVVNVGTTLSHV
jgi:hypothetical protein